MATGDRSRGFSLGILHRSELFRAALKLDVAESKPVLQRSPGILGSDRNP
jgi:hypothetical protein